MQTMTRIAAALALGSATMLMLGSAAMGQDDQQTCHNRWLQAEAAGITYGEGFVGGVPTVQVDARTWASIDFATKQGMVDTFNCAVAGPGKTLTVIEFVSNMTNNVVGRWEIGSGLKVIE